jgi:uncharacterized protein (TIGR02147 family)
MNETNYQEFLKNELDSRKTANSSYSLRAFARDLELTPPVLSSILNGKKGISTERAKKIAQKLKLNKNQFEWFVASAGSLHARSQKVRSTFKEKMSLCEKPNEFNELSLDYFKVIADWYHFAILELTYLENFQADFEWIAEKLGISTKEVSDAVARLLKLDLLEIKNGRWIDTFKFLVTPNDVPSLSLKKYHSQLIQKSQKALFDQDVEKREYGSHVVSIDSDKLPELKKYIREFRNNFEKLVNSSKKKNDVYCLSLQFFSLTNVTKENL